ncbi:MAG TPA: hypothetical protein VGE74_00715 [Gemmata sp.]
MPPADADRDQFFIGWFPVPPGYARVLVPTALVLVLALVATGAVLAWAQRSPGPGVWDDGATTFTGIVFAEPYAMVRVPPGAPGGPPRTVLLVEEGKFGAQPRAGALDGKPARVSGTLLSRSGRLMLELAPGEEGLRAADLSEAERAALRRSPPRARGAVSLRGEIVDSKCYLGAMKPGAGRAHRGCARLCLRGGVPPLFVGEGGGTLYLLTNPAGGPLHPLYFDRAGDALRLSGEWEEWDDLHVLKLAPPAG